MPGILVFSENTDTLLELVTKGKDLKGELGIKLGVLLLQSGADTVSRCYGLGADTVFQTKDAAPSNIDASSCARVVAGTASEQGLNIVLVGSTRPGKEVAAMVAQLLDAGCVTDATDIRVQENNLIVERYTLGGSTVASLTIRTPNQVIAVMPRTFQKGVPSPAQAVAVPLAVQPGQSYVKVIDRQEKKGEAAPIEEAETLICIGRGLAKQTDIPMIEALAKAMKAEIGCTRPLTHDWQWFPESREVGLSGKKCKPALCLSIGISGQIQHTVGIRNSKVIAAINKDKNAPIFKTADYGIVADLYDVVPRLTRKIQSSGK